MKAVIPVAGAGTRLRPLTYTQPKALIPIAGKPTIAFIIDQLVAEGFKEFVFITGYLGEKIEDHITKKYADLKTYFVNQDTREGLGHAIWSARDLIKPKDEILIVLGDTIFEADLKSVLSSPHSSLGVKKVEDPRQFGVAEIDEEGFIKKVVEKPKIPKSNMALVGVYKIKEAKALMDELDKNIKAKKRTAEEFHLTDALQQLIEGGVRITSFNVDNWYDCGKKEVLLETNAILLKKSGYASKKIPFFENTIIVHPVSIANNVKISNSIIGPYVAIGENTEIQYSIVKNSIIGNFAKIEDASLHHSIIGSDASIKGITQSLNIGDNTEIDFS